jgi:hypothetical protein
VLTHGSAIDNVKTADSVSLPLVPVTAIVELPTVAKLLAVSVSVTLPTDDVLTEGAEKLAVTPAGRPLNESVAVPLKPCHADTSTV